MQLSMWLNLIIVVAVMIGFALGARQWIRRVRKALRLIRESREQTHRDGMICIRCGYNIRVSPKRCSECGYEP